jgi:stage III sporulation protein SpoIIIAA
MIKLETNDLNQLMSKLPSLIRDHLKEYDSNEQLLEIIIDLGRRPEARFITGSKYLSQKLISWQDLDYVTKRIGKFSNENRTGIERTLHRISCIRNRQFLINGLSCRVGRAIFGTISIIRDLLEFDQSLLILGRPGVGKTTVIREIARVLSDEMEKRVIIIDTSNEIGGDSDIPHSAIGRARRMQVANTELQHQIMLEAVENHMPQVIIIDEIATELEVLTARTIAEKGVQLIGTTHGNCLENLIKNPSLTDLIGGIQYVTLSDDEAKRRGTQKSILERKSYPTFEVLIELNEQNLWTIHENVKDSIDLFLRENFRISQNRQFLLNDKLLIKCKKFQTNFTSFTKNSNYSEMILKNNWPVLNIPKEKNFLNLTSKKLIIYPYSLPKNLLKEVLLKTRFQFILTHEIKKANLIIGLKKHLKQNFKLKSLAKQKNIPIYMINQISVYQISKLIQYIEHR